jgi:hypothetical protein
MTRYVFFKKSIEAQKKGTVVPCNKYAFEYEEDVHIWSEKGLKVFCVQWNMAGKVV